MKKNTVLLSTSLVTIGNSSGDAIKLRAFLDSGPQASFVTEDVANALMLPTQRSRINVSAMGCSHSQKTPGLLPVKLNHTIEVNLQLILKITNTDIEIVVSTKRHMNNLNSPVSTFNVPNKLDLLLGADVIEDVCLITRERITACAFEIPYSIGLCLVLCIRLAVTTLCLLLQILTLTNSF